MTVKDVEERIEMLRRKIRDPEEAHIYEDGIWEAVLLAIANHTNVDSAPLLAGAALKTIDINFPRWYA